jgi:5-methylcytosine-specific restriction enzyme A
MGSWGRAPTPRHVRLAVLQRDQFVCQLGYPRCEYFATEVDHIVSTAALGVSREHVGVDDCQAVCASCHRTKSLAEQRAGIKASAARRAARRKLPKQPHPGET